MKSLFLILFIVVATIATGCTSMPRGDISGTWTMMSGAETILIQLDKTEHWSWRGLQEASPTQEGRWFIHDNILVLRVEKSKSDKLPPGVAFTWDLRGVTTNRLTLYALHTEQEEHWERSANQPSDRTRSTAPVNGPVGQVVTGKER